MLNQNELSVLLKKYRLTISEYEYAKSLIGKELNSIEWALFSALWSEHCSYKSSKIHLKKFSKTLNQYSSSVGENAGVLDIGQSEKIAFKMESHNHPSFIEPFQGAATGVGGILRDVFTMGARPIANANYLCFGEFNSEAKNEKMSKLLKGVVEGISHYGNCVGVPTVTGQTNFHPKYNQNILVNAMALGYFGKNDKVAKSAVSGVGNWVVYIGAKTGKDGVHGAAMASESFSEDSDSKKPNVQIGDPYYEKLLIESTLEIIQKDLVESIQDMGAAGLISSSFEMSAKGGLGLEIHLDKVPVRDSTIRPEEILLSESQERMLLICQPQNYLNIENIIHRYGLEISKIGQVVADRNIKLFYHNELLTDINPSVLVDQAPLYERPYSEEKLQKLKEQNINQLLLDQWNQTQAPIQKEDLFPRENIYEQYDQRVGLNTIHDASYDVAILRLPESHRPLGMVVGCRPQIMELNAWVGACDAVYYPYLQLACKGLRGIGLTDCLNFGNPEKSDVMTDFVASVEGITLAAKTLNTPVISGNVSFYNETLQQNIIPTPATGMVGISNECIDNFKYNENPFPKDSLKDFHSYANANASINVNEKLDLYLLSCPLQVMDPMAATQIKSFASLLRFISRTKGVLVTNMVSLQGLQYSINKIQSPSCPFNLSDLTTADQSVFYQCLVVVEKELDLKNIFSDWKKNNPLMSNTVGELDILTIKKIGSTVAPNSDCINHSGFKDECGVFGVWNYSEAAKMTYLGLYAMQHRGQESAGIVSCDTNNSEHFHHKGLGLVGDVFKESDLQRLKGHAAIGHVRYSTTGDNLLTNAQPLTANLYSGPIAVAHNGNIVNTSELKTKLKLAGSIFQGTNDTEVLLHQIARHPSDQILNCLKDSLPKLVGAFSFVILTKDRLLAARDPGGFRPLVMGQKKSESGDISYIFASETCAFDLVGAEFLREVEPGEIVMISKDGIQSEKFSFQEKKSFCVFEHVYFSRPDSVVFNQSVYRSRTSFGEMTAKENPIQADLVIPVPDSGTAAALGYSRFSGIPLEFGIIRNHYVGRTFIQPEASIRDFGVKIKLNPQSAILNGKRVIVVDDSLVRGTTSKKIVQLIRQAGAKEVHMRIASPPTIGPCFYGVDTPQRKQLIAASSSINEICDFIGADSLGYLSLQGLFQAMGFAQSQQGKKTYCAACFDGDYPTPVQI